MCKIAYNDMQADTCEFSFEINFNVASQTQNSLWRFDAKLNFLMRHCKTMKHSQAKYLLQC